eukprot:g823.t1
MMTKWDESPTPGQPVEVDFQLEVKAIQDIDARRGMASVILDICLSWRDPRVEEACKRDQGWEPPAQLWAPGVWLANGVLEREQLVFEDSPGHLVRVSTRPGDRARGLLFIWLTFTGEVDNPMDLEDFPFDEDSLDFRFVGCRMLNGRLTDTQYNLRPKDGDKFVQFWFNSHLPEFQLLGVSYIKYRKFKHSMITAGISLRREHRYYFFKVTILMWLIVLLSMPVFLYDFNELEQRMGLVSTMFLATAATLYVVGSDLPKTRKLNKMDKLLLGTLAVIFAAGAESIAVSFLHGSGDLDTADALEHATVVALPVLYVFLNAVLFGVPALKACCRDMNCLSHVPQSVRKGRTFIPWDRINKVDPWAADSSDVKDKEVQEIWEAPMRGGEVGEVLHHTFC